jgi:CHAT domain-containing protein
MLISTLPKEKRWRAVHLACHGLVDPERPQLSSLALTADNTSDGFFTVLEVFRSKIPADLVVLSACETGKGKIYRSEGIVGFTRAFMLAGAPRVIVSLWRVDDEATRALMVKLYELWKPGKMATATALKKAQEFVRGHEKWKHPYYWAAWQLWGSPD